MNIIYNILISAVAVTLLSLFIIGAIRDSKKSMNDLRESRDKKHAH